MDSIYEIIEKNFSYKRKIHTYGVVETAKSLALQYGADVKKAEIAALYHDLFRGVQINVINYYVNHIGLDKKYIDNPNLAHSKIAAHVMKYEYGIEDKEILSAVEFHTTGRANMSLLEKIIFIADAIEPNRNYPGVDRLREVVRQSLDEACLMSLQSTIDFVSNKKEYLDEDTVKARDYLLKERQIGN